MQPPPDISALQLLGSVCLVLVAGGISAALRLGLLRSLAWGTLRTFVQLLLVGYVLKYVFAIDHPLLILALVAVMSAVAARAAVKRVEMPPFSLYGMSALALSASTLLIGTIVCRLLIAEHPWYAPRVAIPIAGMLLGNTLTGVSLASDRFFGEMRARRDQVELRLSWGFTRWEATLPQLRRAMRAGLTPMLNALMVVGIVSLPGMMTGQILAGSPPLLAVRYQIVVMMMLTASAAIGSLVVVGLCCRSSFTPDDALIDDLTRG